MIKRARELQLCTRLTENLPKREAVRSMIISRIEANALNAWRMLATTYN